MAGSINVNQNNNNVDIQDQNGRLTITDNNAGTTINVTQPVTNVVTVATIGPQGPQGPIGPIPTSGSFTGAFTGSFSGSFTGSLQGTASNAVSASYALTASYLQGYISPFPFTGSARITGSLGVTGSISTTTQFYHSSSLDSSNRILSDENNNTSIDWNNRWLVDATGQQPNIKWNDTDTFGITTIPIIENFDHPRILAELQYAYDNERTIVSGKILERANVVGGLTNGTLVYYNKSNDQWENFPQSSVSFPDNYLTGSIGVICNGGEGVLLEGTITTIVNSADPTASFGPTIIGDPEIGSALFAAGSLSNPATDTVFSTQYPTTNKDTQRMLGHIIGKKSVDTGVDSYLIYFNPSNDFYTLVDGGRIGTIDGNDIYAQYAVTTGNATSASFASTSSYLNTLNQDLTITGSIRSTGGFTGSLLGTSSYATQALTASYVLLAQTSSLALRVSGSLTGSLLGTATTASYVLLAQTASFVQTAQTASYVLNAQTASFIQQAVSASYTITASFIETKTVFNQPILGTGNVGFVTRSFSQSIDSNSTGETQLLQITIPANTFSASDKLAFFAFFSKVGTASNTTHRIKISTSSSMPTGGTSQVAQYASANTIQFTKINRELTINGGFLKGYPFSPSAVTDAGVSTTAMSSAPFDVTQTQYVYVSVTPTTTPTTDVTRLEAFEIKNI
jgi:hypothetical protein